MTAYMGLYHVLAILRSPISALHQFFKLEEALEAIGPSYRALYNVLYTTGTSKRMLLQHFLSHLPGPPGCVSAQISFKVNFVI